PPRHPGVRPGLHGHPLGILFAITAVGSTGLRGMVPPPDAMAVRCAGPASCEALMHETREPMDLCDYLLETLRQDGEFILYRGRHRHPGEAGPPTLLLVTPLAERPAPASLRRMEQEYSSRADLDPEWAAQPLALVSHNGRTMLVLADPGGEPL